jgi:hypothetical protein
MDQGRSGTTSPVPPAATGGVWAPPHRHRRREGVKPLTGRAALSPEPTAHFVGVRRDSHHAVPHPGGADGVLTLVTTGVFTSIQVFAARLRDHHPTSGARNSAPHHRRLPRAWVRWPPPSARERHRSRPHLRTARRGSASSIPAPRSSSPARSSRPAVSASPASGSSSGASRLDWATVAGQDLRQRDCDELPPAEGGAAPPPLRGGTNVASATSAVVATKVTVSTAAAGLASSRRRDRAPAARTFGAPRAEHLRLLRPDHARTGRWV